MACKQSWHTEEDGAEHDKKRPQHDAHKHPIEQGAVLQTSLCTSGETANDGWVRLSEHISANESGEGWVLIDGRLLGLGCTNDVRPIGPARQGGLHCPYLLLLAAATGTSMLAI